MSDNTTESLQKLKEEVELLNKRVANENWSMVEIHTLNIRSAVNDLIKD